MDNQQQVWNNIAEEWNEFKIEPAKHVLDFLKGKKGKILDFGSGSGRHLKKIPKGEMYLVDFSENMIKFAKKKAKDKKITAKFFVSPLTKLPFEDDFFDSAIAIASIHCIKGEKNREKAVKELFRVLKKGAQADIAVWNKNANHFKNSPKEKYVGWRDKGKRYYYLFTPEEIYSLFKKVGFKILSKEEPQRNIIFIVQKPMN
ncbi:MAG TPA: class I SAM-dependent methyltransferase [Patescibacteria group bacterium]|nr:class I SAM-dependent methyltransferase [Patescibacteria group bacterium]